MCIPALSASLLQRQPGCSHLSLILQSRVLQRKDSNTTLDNIPLHIPEEYKLKSKLFLLQRNISNPNHPSTTMSFGFGVGDFLALGKLVWDVYSAYADAPEQFRNFSQEILLVHVVFGKVEDQLRIQGFGNSALGNNTSTWTISVKDADGLKILHGGLRTTMEELDALLKKYHSLSENHSICFDRLKWGQEDLVQLRGKLRSNLNLLNTFNSSLAKYVYSSSRVLYCSYSVIIFPRPADS